jgi:hypothetical protein
VGFPHMFMEGRQKFRLGFFWAPIFRRQKFLAACGTRVDKRLAFSPMTDFKLRFFNHNILHRQRPPFRPVGSAAASGADGNGPDGAAIWRCRSPDLTSQQADRDPIGLSWSRLSGRAKTPFAHGPACSFESVAMLLKWSSYCVKIVCLPTMQAKQLASVTTATLAAISTISASP